MHLRYWRRRSLINQGTQTYCSRLFVEVEMRVKPMGACNEQWEGKKIGIRNIGGTQEQVLVGIVGDAARCSIMLINRRYFRRS